MGNVYEKYYITLKLYLRDGIFIRGLFFATDEKLTILLAYAKFRNKLIGLLHHV